jgi:hypothetical protein
VLPAVRRLPSGSPLKRWLRPGLRRAEDLVSDNRLAPLQAVLGATSRRKPPGHGWGIHHDMLQTETFAKQFVGAMALSDQLGRVSLATA